MSINDCLFCEGRKLCGHIDCKFCKDKSFAVCDKAEYWNPSNKDKPHQLFPKSSKKRLFICNFCGMDYNTRIADVTIGQWHNCTRHKTEALLLKWLHEKFPGVKIDYQYKGGCINPLTNRDLIMDFKIGKVHIELDGPQHTSQVMNWASPDKTRLKDIYKMMHYYHKNENTIRIDQKGVWNNIIDLNKLKEQIIRLNNVQNPEIVYIDIDGVKTDKYEKHKYDFNNCLHLSPEQWYNTFSIWYKKDEEISNVYVDSKYKMAICNYRLQNSESIETLEMKFSEVKIDC